MNLFTERIKLIRGDTPVKEFAGKIGVSPAYVYALESGEKTVISETLAELISTKFNIERHWLLTGEGPIKRKGVVSEDPSPYLAEDPTLSLLIRKLKRIYNDGDRSQKAAARGMIDELYDEIRLKKPGVDINENEDIEPKRDIA